MVMGFNGCFRRQLGDPNVAKVDTRRRIMSLQTDRSLFKPATVPFFVFEWAIIGPINDMDAINPCCYMPALGDNGHREPILVLGYFKASWNASIDAAGAIIGSRVFLFFRFNQLVGLGIELINGVFLLRLGGETIVNLRLIALLKFAGPAAKED